MLPLLLVASVAVQGAASKALPPVIPKPVSMVAGAGAFTITGATVLIDPGRTTASAILEDMFAKGAGFRLPYAKRPGHTGAIEFIRAPKGSLRDGEYKLHAGTDGIRIWYGDKGGALYGVETLRQLLPVAIEGPKASKGVAWTVPAVDITDYPRFSWRGMHLDVSRHFFPVSFIKKYLDYIAMMKMNVFHWHLVDDGGWRIQIDKYPKLTSVGAWRYGITTDWDQSRLRFDPQSELAKYGGFYTKQQVREIVKYAADRNITVVPEIEMPGHAMPVFAAYPEMGCEDQPPSRQPGQPSTNVYCAGNEKTYKFIENVLDEVMALFPSKWIHIGGDEVDKEFWHRCPLCQAKMKAEGLKNEEELQIYFVRRIDKYIASKGRRLIGWDEILEGGLAKGATVMSWRGIDGGIAAARSGHDVVMSPTGFCYFDYPYSDQPTEHVYSFEPVPAGLSPEEAKHVLGGQANVWTERIPTEARCEYMIWPRMAAMAEVLWTPKAERNLEDFLSREGSLYPRLDRLGTTYFLAAPRVAVNAVLFDKPTQVAARVVAGIPGKLRYTMDGSLPTGRSSVYSGPLTVDRPTTIEFAYVTAGGKPGDVSKVDCRPDPEPNVRRNRLGWGVRYYEGEWTRVPDFEQLQPAITGYMNKAGFLVRRRDENFALDLSGFFKADKDGVYRFSLESDDGSWLKVGGATVVDNDGLHAPNTTDGWAWLSKGWHKIEIGYFQAGGAFSLGLEVQPPGTAKAERADNLVYTDAR